jgi:hypothetical protein
MFINENIIRRALRQSINEMMQEDRVESQDGTVEIDNFQNVRDIMNFKNPGDTLYFVELIRRKKDNPSMNHSRQFIGQYYFKSQQEFDSAEQAIKDKCKKQGARAYIYLNARSKAVVDKYTQIYAARFAKNSGLARHFGNNPMAFAAGRSFDAPDRPLCFIDIDSADFKDISMAMKIIQDAGITPLFAYRSMNNGLHIILPDKDAAKKLDFTPINGNLNGLSQFAKNNAKVSVEIDKPTLLYASLKPNGYDAQQARLQKFINQRNQRNRNNNRRHP